MSLKAKIFKGAIVLTGGQAVTQVLSFARNIIVARLLSPDNMGIAATFAITIMLLEMISNLSVDMLLVQAKDGDDPLFQGTAHFYQVLRGFSVGLIIFACAPVITWLFKTPEAEWAYRLLALVPIFRGFMHLDWKRLQRKMQYRTAVLVELVPQSIITLVAFPLAVWLGDYSAVLWLVLMQAAIGLLISHLFSDRPYRLNWDREYGHRLLVFGWPLLINGLLMFGALQGDRLIIGTFYTMAELGVYSVAFSLAITLATVITKISNSLFLPLLASKQDQEEAFREHYKTIVQILAVIGGAVALPFVTAGGQVIILLFGKQYLAAFSFAPWLGALLVARIFRLAPTVAALAGGDTKNSMYANFFRLIGVFAAIAVAWVNLSLSAIIMCGVGGEILALLFASLRLHKLQKLKAMDSLYPPLIVAVVLLIAGLSYSFSIFGISLYGYILNFLLFFIALLVVSLAVFPVFGCEIKKMSLNFRANSQKR